MSSLLCDSDRVLVHERSVAKQQRDIVPGHLIANHVHFRPHDMPAAVEQVFHCDGLLDRVALAVDGPLADAGQMQHRLADRFAGNGSGVDADAPDAHLALDHRHAFAQLGGTQRRLLACRAGPDNCKIVMEFRHRVSGSIGQTRGRDNSQCPSRHFIHHRISGFWSSPFAPIQRTRNDFNEREFSQHSSRTIRAPSMPSRIHNSSVPVPAWLAILTGSVACFGLVWFLCPAATVNDTPLEVGYRIALTLAGLLVLGAIAAASWKALHSERVAGRELRRMLEILPRVRTGELAIDELKKIDGALSGLCAEVQEMLHELRQQRSAIAAIEAEVPQRSCQPYQRLGTYHRLAAAAGDSRSDDRAIQPPAAGSASPADR